MQRFGLGDDQRERIKDFLPGREGHVGGNAADNRLFVEAVLYRYRTGIPWRDLPARFRRLEDRASALQSMGEERRFRAHFQVVGKRSRQRIHDDRCYQRARSSAQRRRAKKTARKRSADLAVDCHQNSRARRCLGQSRRVDAHARPSS
jgi:transposase